MVILQYQGFRDNPDLISDLFCLHKIEGGIVQIFVSIGGFALHYAVLDTRKIEFFQSLQNQQLFRI